MVYVDKVRPRPKSAAWPYGPCCRMFADSINELLAFGRLLGLSVVWLHFGASEVPSFDIVATKRDLALAQGAREADPATLDLFARRAQAGEFEGAERGAA